MSQLEQFQDPDSLIEFLVLQTPERTTQDACSDCILVEYFFPLVGPRFKEESYIYDTDIARFKAEFPYEKFGLDGEAMKKAIDKLRSIRAIIDSIVKQMPLEVKNRIACEHLKRIWFEMNSGSDFERFKESINNDYWQFA